MLDLYRASAGSGKTYTLAKKYIWYFITIMGADGKVRLRTDGELADSARHILAVTFTNKATNEMQMRIVESLFALASYPEKSEIREIPDKRVSVISKPDYMQAFVDELGVNPDEIARVCGKALAILLENYSDFNVSTIDSFFQQVLRTFAYESEINDAYQVEIDSAYLSTIGVDKTLEEIDNNADDTDTRYWVQKLIDRTAKGKWNIFTRSEYSREENPYKNFIDSVKKMETEQYKENRKEIEDYFRSGSDFRQLYEDLSDRYENPVKEAYSKMKEAFKNFYSCLPDDLRSARPNAHIGKYKSACTKIGKFKNWDYADVDSPLQPEEILKLPKMEQWMAQNPEFGSKICDKYEEAYQLYDNWLRLAHSMEFLHWKLYSVNLPYYALFGIVTRKRQEYLDETNAIELGETSMILKGIIGEDDTPFVYERMGNNLDHFLIDEFQDTSRMQWSNLAPLLRESIARGKENLIIGDAKQSIYRFRNADPTLIMRHVPNAFRGNVSEKGSLPSENTNYRSELHVVEFNNSFFKYLASAVDSLTRPSETGRLSFKDLYSNVEQTPNKTGDEGYIEIRQYEGNKETFENEVNSQLPQLICELMDRGFEQKDIAVLVNTNEEGDKVIKSLMEYNLTREEKAREIRFVGERSLKISSSRAVGVIISVLENMARGADPTNRDAEELKIKGLGNWNDIMANIRFYQMQHPDMTLAELLESYLNAGNDFNALSSLLQHLQSFAIPALVEAITATFVPDDLRKTDAIYISAFQDIVLEYCDSHPIDIGSFLNWWERKSKSASVSSPEGTNAVQVLTIHKSKGLQYKCVIAPFVNWSMADEIPKKGYREWIWVKPSYIEHDTIQLPPVVPVETSPEILGTQHEAELINYFDMSKMDRINKAYVAFTRAEKELYIFSQLKAKAKKSTLSAASDMKIGRFLREFLSEYPEAEESLDSNIFTIGRKYNPRMKKMERAKLEGKNMNKEKEESEKSVMTLALDSYDSVSSPDFIKYKDSDMPSQNAVNDEESDMDPRSEGNIKHAVLELVNKADDLPDAVRHLVITGIIPDSKASGILESLSFAIHGEVSARWFDGSARVMAERPILLPGSMTRRPDRVMIYPDGHAEVVDYKFGQIDTSNKYRNQIARYVRLLKETGLYTDVKGYIWYVNENHITEV